MRAGGTFATTAGSTLGPAPAVLVSSQALLAAWSHDRSVARFALMTSMHARGGAGKLELAPIQSERKRL
jgi:hypothetical protein